MGKEGIGDVFVDQRTEAHTTPYRFVNQSFTLQRLQIRTTGQNIRVGRQGKQVFPVKIGTPLILHNIDLADLWFLNDVASAIVSLIGTTRD